jgi:hypothetical protein
MNTRAEKFTKLAELLGGTARPLDRDRPENDYHITLADGVQIFAHPGGYGNEGRMHFSGSWPSYRRAEGGSCVVIPREIYEDGKPLAAPDITVAETKTAEQIAKDIERRLLPTLRHVWLACKARCDSSIAYQDTRREIVERAAKATGGKANVRDERARIEYGYDTGTAEYYGGYSDQAPYFKLTLEHVTEAQLAAVLKVLRV